MHEVKLRWGKPHFELLCPRKPVADDPIKILIRGTPSQPWGVAKCSESGTSQVSIEHAAIQRSRNALSPELVHGMIAPFHYEQTQLGPVMLQPYHPPMSDGKLRFRMDCFRFQHPVLNWLRQVVAHTMGRADERQIKAQFGHPLHSLAADSAMSPEIHAACEIAIARLDSGAWQPRTCLMHSDFWAGNLLKNKSKGSQWPFVVIDWAGAQAAGYPFVDLLRVSSSLCVRRNALQREIDRYAQVVGGSSADVRAYLLSYFGWLGQNLHEFPVERYHALVHRTFAQIDQLIPALK